MIEIIPLKFEETQKDYLEAESIFGKFAFWKVLITEDKKQKEFWYYKSLDKKSKRFYTEKENSKEKAEKKCQTDYKNMFKGIFKEI